jgi:hypothetical protein
VVSNILAAAVESGWSAVTVASLTSWALWTVVAAVSVGTLSADSSYSCSGSGSSRVTLTLSNGVSLQLEPVSHDGWDARLVRLAAACVTSGLFEWPIGTVLLEESRPLVPMVALGLDFADYFYFTGCRVLARYLVLKKVLNRSSGAQPTVHQARFWLLSLPAVRTVRVPRYGVPLAGGGGHREGRRDSQ